MAGDPSFAKLASELADVNAQYFQDGRRLGEANPVLVNLKHRAEKLDEKLRNVLGGSVAGPFDTSTLLLAANGSQSADMIRALVNNTVLLVGRNAEKAAPRLARIHAAGGKGYFVSAEAST